MNTRPHQQPPHGNATPAAEHRPRHTTTQTWDHCRHNTHAAVLPDAFHDAARVPEANSSPLQHADTPGGRP
jgi:hypothetical protein